MQTSGVIEMNMSRDRLYRFRADQALLLEKAWQVPYPQASVDNQIFAWSLNKPDVSLVWGIIESLT